MVEGLGGDAPLMPEHVFDPFKFGFVRKLEQLVDGDPEEDGDARQQRDVRHAGFRLPFAHGLDGHAQVLRQLLLLHFFFQAQVPDLFSDFHILPSIQLSFDSVLYYQAMDSVYIISI